MEIGVIKNKLKESFLFKKIYIVVFKLIIAGGLISFIIYKVNPAQIYSAFENANLALIFLALLLTALNLFLQFKKWKLTSRNFLHDSENKKIWYSLFYGIAAGSFTPVRIGEYFGRALEFKDKPILQVTFATLVDKFFTLIVVAFLGSIASILFLHYYYNVTFLITISLFIVFFLLFYFLIMVLLSPKFWNNFIFTYFKSKERFNNFFKYLETVKSLDKHYSAKMAGLSVIFYSCIIVQFAILTVAFTNHTNFFNYLWAGNLVMFAKFILPPVSLAEIGIREGASIFFLTKMGEVASAAFDASIFLFLINVLLPSLIGVVLLFKRNNA